jgi:DNA-binding transcriptional ArsR family regulator
MGSVGGELRAKGIPAPAPAPVLQVDVGTAYELVLGLRMFVDRDEEPTSYALGAEWFVRTRARLDEATLRAIERYSGGHEILFGYLLARAAEAPPPRDGAAFLAVLDEISPATLRRIMLGYRLETYRGTVSRETIAAAAAGDEAAQQSLLEGCADWQRMPYEHTLSLDAVEAKRLLTQAARGWYEAVLHPDERATARVLKRSARAARALADVLTPEEVIDTATRGIRYSSEPGIRRILLVPHLVSRPWSIFTESGDTKIVCYGLVEAQVTGDAPPDPLVAAYKALGDETRLRILRRLAAGPATLQELTQLLGLAKSTVHGHLLVLRTAGLVVADITKRAGYRLRRETLAESAALLESYLQGMED